MGVRGERRHKYKQRIEGDLTVTKFLKEWVIAMSPKSKVDNEFHWKFP